MSDRVTAVYVTPRNGAWLISAGLTRLSEDCVSDELFDAASSVRVAKHLARELARNLGYVGPFYWFAQGEHGFALEARIPEEVA